MPGTLATVLYAICLHEFGTEVHSWEPETVYFEIRDTFGVELPPASHDRLMALLVAIDTDAFYKRYSAFEHMCKAINGDVAQGDELLVPEMSWAVAEVMLNDDQPGKFNHDIAAAVGHLLANDGFVRPPARLHFAKIPEQYLGSDTPADMSKDGAISTAHEKVVSDYMMEQAALLIRQLAALPWVTESDLAHVVESLSKEK